MAPLGSVTAPEILPVSACANANAEQSIRKTMTISGLAFCMVCPLGEFIDLTSPQET
jgi:hypothetical protein